MTRMAATRSDKAYERRQSDLAAIHIAAKQLGLDRETYVAIVHRISGKASSADLDHDGRRALLDELRRLGAPRPPVRTRRGTTKPGDYPGRPRNADSNAMPEMITKIEAQLTDMKLEWAYADAIVRRMFKIEKVAWCRKPEQLRALIAALHVEQEKRDLNNAIDARLKLLAIDPVDLVQLLAPLRPNWRRHRHSLLLVAKYLGERLDQIESRINATE